MSGEKNFSVLLRTLWGSDYSKYGTVTPICPTPKTMTKIGLEDLETIVRLKEEKSWIWKDIGAAVDHLPESCRKAYQRFKKVRDLPPKEKVRNSMLSAHQGLLIKKTIITND